MWKIAWHAVKPQKAFMKNREIYLMPKSTATLTQSGLLAALLRRPRQNDSELDQRSATMLPWPLTRALGATAGRRRRRGFGRTVRLPAWASPSQ
jgi:hypothetical protein